MGCRLARVIPRRERLRRHLVGLRSCLCPTLCDDLWRSLHLQLLSFLSAFQDARGRCFDDQLRQNGRSLHWKRLGRPLRIFRRRIRPCRCRETRWRKPRWHWQNRRRLGMRPFRSPRIRTIGPRIPACIWRCFGRCHGTSPGWRCLVHRRSRSRFGRRLRSQLWGRLGG